MELASVLSRDPMGIFPATTTGHLWGSVIVVPSGPVVSTFSILRRTIRQATAIQPGRSRTLVTLEIDFWSRLPAFEVRALRVAQSARQLRCRSSTIRAQHQVSMGLLPRILTHPGSMVAVIRRGAHIYQTLQRVATSFTTIRTVGPSTP